MRQCLQESVEDECLIQKVMFVSLRTFLYRPAVIYVYLLYRFRVNFCRAFRKSVEGPNKLSVNI